MVSRFAVLCLLMLLAFRPALAAETQARVALVIGNWTYESAPLRNPKNDVRAMTAVLAELGFEVIVLENGTQRDIRRAVLDFGRVLRATQGFGLFYYAGHGVQVEGRNFLIPVDAIIESEEEVPIEGVDISNVLARMEAANNGLNVVILDACRNNPFARSFRSASQGLASIDAPVGTLIAYATAPGNVALDGEGDNGLYTGELVKAMAIPDIPVEEAFKRVRTAVAEKSGDFQIPWETTSLTGDLFFHPTAANAAAATPKPAEVAAIIGRQFSPGATRGVGTAEGRRRLGHYSTGDGLYGFALDRSGDVPALVVDGDGEILALSVDTGGRDTAFSRDDGQVMVRASLEGDLTAWIPGRGLVPVSRDGGADTLRPDRLSAEQTKATAEQTADALQTLLGQTVPITLPPADPPLPERAWGLIADGLGHVETAVERLAADPDAQPILATELKGMAFTISAASGATYDGDTLTLAISPAAGLAGRPSSYRIQEALESRSITALRLRQTHEQALKAVETEINTACGSALALDMAWDEIAPSETDAAKWCEAWTAPVANLCRHPVARDAIAKQISKIRCGFAAERAIALEDGVLDITSDRSARDAREFVHRFLMNNL
ncbi:MAG: caspase family protein [Magnetospiraceae bacterium]